MFRLASIFGGTSTCCGLFCGEVTATAPYGFKTFELDTKGNKGMKKHLEVDSSEAAMVNKIFQLYLSGHQGKTLGMKGIAAHLNNAA